MKPAAFDYIRVDTVDEALEVLADANLEAKVLAGGQSLLPMMNMRLAAPATLVDVNGLGDLRSVERKTIDGCAVLDVGALVRQRQLEQHIADDRNAQLIHAALQHIGHPQTRNQGTVGGSIAHADPSAELPLVFATLGGTAYARSAQGARPIPADEFFISYFTTALTEAEMLTSVQLRLPAPNAGTAFHEFRRRHGDFALVAAACVMELNDNRAVRRVRLGLGGVADTPVLIDAADQLVGERCTPQRAREIAASAAEHLELADDMTTSSAYRRQLVTVLAARALEGAYEDARVKEDGHATQRA